jgi:outer membrane protein assembly factor BamB
MQPTTGAPLEVASMQSAAIRAWFVRSAGRLSAAVLVAVGLQAGRAGSNAIEVSVLQYHKNGTRDGLYADPAFTRAAAARMRIDTSFNAPLQGPTHAQPLFWAAAGPRGRDLVVAATAQNQVHAFDASSGAVVWQRSLGPPVRRSSLPCGNIDPVGITGTPVIDAASRTLLFDAMTTPDGGLTTKHLIYGLSIDDGATRPGWPVDVGAAVRVGSQAFESGLQNQRGALALLGGTLYVPYGGHFGDCGSYRGWVVGVPLSSPSRPIAWTTRAVGGGVWAPGGVAVDGQSIYVATGNTFNASGWSDGEAIIRLPPDLAFSRQPADFFAPVDWPTLDATDSDLGGSGPVLLEVPGTTPSRLVVALGKNGDAYLIDRANMGGVSAGLARRRVSGDPIITAAASYSTNRGTYVVLKGGGIDCPAGQSGDLTAIRIEATAPPTITVAWCANQNGGGSPIVTTTDGRSEAVVWSIGAQGDNRLYAFDGDTGQVLLGDGSADNVMSPRIRRYQTPIAAKGRIFVATDTRLYAFTSR